MSTILNARAVENLPNLNRNFTAFELLTPGTTYIGWGPGEGSGNPRRSQSIEVNGQLPFATGYELDGTDNQDPLNGVAVINPNLDSVSEMKGPPGYTFPPIPADGNYVLPDGIYQIARPFKVRLPTVAGWNVMVQQELTSTMSLQVAYIGSHSYHNMFESSPSFNANEQTLNGFNQINPETGMPYTVPERSPYYDGTAQRELGVKWGVPHGWTQRVDYMANLADNSYDALQIVMNKRFTSGLQFLTHYTWSHALGHESYEFLIDPKIGRGNGYYNRRHQFVFAGDYDLPFGRDMLIGSGVSGWVNQIIGGFQLNAALTIDGGIPFNTNYADCSLDNDVGANDNACFLNKVPAEASAFTRGRIMLRVGMFHMSSPHRIYCNHPGRRIIHSALIRDPRSRPGETSGATLSGDPA